MAQDSFLKIPIPLLGQAFTNQQDYCDKIFAAGLINAARDTNLSTRAAVAQCLYDFAFTGDIPRPLEESINEMVDKRFLDLQTIESWLTEDGRFRPDNEMLEGICDALADDDPLWVARMGFALMLPDFVLFGRLQRALHTLRLEGDAARIFEQYDSLSLMYRNLFDAPFARVPIDSLLDFSDEWQNYTNVDFAIFAAYLATLSIVGSKPHALTTIDTIAARMVGKVTRSELTDFPAAEPILQEAFKTWSGRRKSAFLLDELHERYGLQRATGNRCIAISYRLDEKQLQKMAQRAGLCLAE